MFTDINRGLCDNYNGLDPLKVLDYAAEDVFDLINATIDHNSRQSDKGGKSSGNVIRRPAGDDWF